MNSKSAWGAPVLFVKKPNTTKLRMCIDYRYLNKHTVRDATPIPRSDELRQRLQGAKAFTALDLMSGYYQIRIEDEDQAKTAFNTRYGHFEWLVMPFGLTNAPATFSRWINENLGEFLDSFVVAYLDDILIFSKNKEDHFKHVQQVLSKLSDAGAILNLNKSFFGLSSVEFLGHVVSEEGLSIKPAYVDLKDLQDVNAFCGLVNFFKAWIPGYADILEPLNRLRKKTVPFQWTEQEHMAMKTLQ